MIAMQWPQLPEAGTNPSASRVIPWKPTFEHTPIAYPWASAAFASAADATSVQWAGCFFATAELGRDAAVAPGPAAGHVVRARSTRAVVPRGRTPPTVSSHFAAHAPSTRRRMNGTRPPLASTRDPP
jgi:hypothetical protein